MLSDIHELVHSLTKAEKRYFKRSASMHTIGEKNTYLKLFEALNSQKKFNEEEIAYKFRGQHLYLLKRHLQKSLLKSLRSFHSASSTTIQIHSFLNEVEVLFKKGLIKQALKHVHHAKKLASHHERHLELLQLLAWEIKLLIAPHKHVYSRKKILTAFSDEDKEIGVYKNFLSAFRFRFNALALHNKEIILSKKDKEQHSKFTHEINYLSKKYLSGKAQWQLYCGAGNYFSTIGNYTKSSMYHKKAGKIFARHSAKLSDDLRQYLLSIYMQSISSYYLKKYNEALQSLKILAEVFSSLPDFSNNKNIFELLLHSLLLESFILMDMGFYQKALPVITRLQAEMEKQGSVVNISLRNDFYYQQIGYWFCMGDFKQSHSWLNKLLQNENAPKENPARYRFARLMQLIILSELMEFDQIENLLPATRKFLRKKGQQYKIEEELLVFISKYIRSEKVHSEKFPEGGLAYKREKFTVLKKKILRLAKDKNEATALQIFDYVKWAEAKIEGKTIAEIQK